MATDWFTEFNRHHDVATRRLDTLQRIRKLHERARKDDMRVFMADEPSAFATVIRIAHEDHREAVRHMVRFADPVPLDALQVLTVDARQRLGDRLAALGADEGEVGLLAAGLKLDAPPYPLLGKPKVVGRAELLDLVLARCNADGLNAASNDHALLLVWETVVQAIPTDDPSGDDAQVAHLATVVLPRLAQAGADLDRPMLGERPIRSTPSPRDRRTHLLGDALLHYQGDVLRQTVAGAGAVGRGRKRL